jgi:hypothetical protein
MNVAPQMWVQSPYLDFIGSFNAGTGEILSRAMKADYHGLKFTLSRSTIDPDTLHHTIRGSIQKYHLSGNCNTGTFTLSNIKEAIKDLSQRFGIDPRKTLLQNVEFGVNITTPRPAKWYIDNLVAHRNLRFCALNIDRVKVGKICSRNDYKLKVYDKAKQAGKADNYTLRIEIAIKKMRLLQPHGITTLADLTDPRNVYHLSEMLISMVSDLIMFDTEVKHEIFSPKDLTKYLQYINPLFWENLDKSNRYKQLKQYRVIVAKYDIHSPINDLLEMIKSECQKAAATAECTAQKRRPIPQLEKPVFDLLQHIKTATFSPLECTVKKSLKPPLEIDKTEIRNFALSSK